MRHKLCLLFLAAFACSLHAEFTITKETHYPAGLVTEAVHEKSGLQVVHLKTDDPENIFGFFFRTPPTSSNGAPHVLEHSLLSGSRLYPAQRDLMPMLKRRSLAIKMNATTMPDITMYYASSQVQEDFYNLCRVYFDGLFHPLLTPLTFAREGHRLEFRDPEDPTSPLEQKGVVYSEMKGRFSSPGEWIVKEIASSLYPDTPYRFHPGGVPDEIPNLTYDELLSFYKRHYHPGNCLLIFSGNIPFEQHLQFLSSLNLEDLQKGDPIAPIQAQARFKQSLAKELYYPSLDENGERILTLSWLTCSMQESNEFFALSILNRLLMDANFGILRKKLISSGACVQASSHLTYNRQDVLYTIIMQGCKEEAIDFLENIVYETLEKLMQDGIDEELVEIVLHQLELATREIDLGSSSFEGTPLFQCAISKLYGDKAVDVLAQNSLFDTFQKSAANPNFFRNLIIKHLYANNHYLRLIAKPNRALENEKQITNALSQSERDEVRQVSRELRAPNQDEASLPQISKEWISPHSTAFELNFESHKGFDLYYHLTNTNGLTYADLVLDFPLMQESEIWLYRLYGYLLSKVGSTSSSYQNSLLYATKYTSGVRVGYANVKGLPKLVLSGKALDENGNKLLRLFYYMITNPNFRDKEHLRELVNLECLNLENALRTQPLAFAMESSSSPDSLLNYYVKVKELKEQFETMIDGVIEKLEKIEAALLSERAPDLIICAEKEKFGEYSRSDFGGLAYLPMPVQAVKREPPVNRGGSTFSYEIASPVAYTAQTFPSLSFCHPDSPAITLASILFTNKVLNGRIREEGGAYGSQAIYNPHQATFTFASYDDPHIASSLAAFNEAIECIASGNFTESDVEEAKLEAIQGLDRPIRKGMRAWYAYSKLALGITNSVDDAFRAKLLSATKTDVESAVQNHIVPRYKESHTVTLSGKELLEREFPISKER